MALTINYTHFSLHLIHVYIMTDDNTDLCSNPQGNVASTEMN